MKTRKSIFGLGTPVKQLMDMHTELQYQAAIRETAERFNCSEKEVVKALKEGKFPVRYVDRRRSA